MHCRFGGLTNFRSKANRSFIKHKITERMTNFLILHVEKILFRDTRCVRQEELLEIWKLFLGYNRMLDGEWGVYFKKTDARENTDIKEPVLQIVSDVNTTLMTSSAQFIIMTFIYSIRFAFISIWHTEKEIDSYLHCVRWPHTSILQQI